MEPLNGTLEVTAVSAHGLEDVRFLSSMSCIIHLRLSSLRYLESSFAAKGSGTSPSWTFTFPPLTLKNADPAEQIAMEITDEKVSVAKMSTPLGELVARSIHIASKPGSDRIVRYDLWSGKEAGKKKGEVLLKAVWTPTAASPQQAQAPPKPVVASPPPQQSPSPPAMRAAPAQPQYASNAGPPPQQQQYQQSPQPHQPMPSPPQQQQYQQSPQTMPPPPRPIQIVSMPGQGPPMPQQGYSEWPVPFQQQQQQPSMSYQQPPPGPYYQQQPMMVSQPMMQPISYAPQPVMQQMQPQQYGQQHPMYAPGPGYSVPVPQPVYAPQPMPSSLPGQYAQPTMGYGPPAASAPQVSVQPSGATAGGWQPQSSVDDGVFPYSELTITRLIGDGTFGTVSAGEFRSTPVAIKQLKQTVFNAQQWAEFMAEVKFLREARHPNIVLFMGVSFNPYCIVTELLDMSLFDVLHKQRRVLSFQQKAHIALGIARGLASLHAHSPPIIHRDIKSLNVLVSKDLVSVKICDLGMVKFKAQHGTRLEANGTPLWMAPEVLLDQPYDEQADVFSYGCVLYELTTGLLPFGGGSIPKEQLIVRVGQKGERPLLPANLEPQWTELLTQCWQQHPQSRPPMKKIVQQLTAIQSSSGS